MANLDSKNTSQKNTQKQGAAGFTRKKTVSKSVLIADKIADRVITIGGILVIIAVLGIMVFLVSETLPLFQSGKITSEHDFTIEMAGKNVLSMAMDEHKTLAFFLCDDGTMTLFHAKTGHLVASQQIDFGGKTVTSFDDSIDREHFAFGFDDGSVMMVQARFTYQVLTANSADIPRDLQKIDERDSTNGEAFYSRIPGNQVRVTAFELEAEEPIQVAEEPNPILALDYHVSGKAERQLKTFAVMDSTGVVTLNLAESKINLMTGKRTTKVKQVQLPPLPEAETLDLYSLLLTEKADFLMITDKDGTVYRYNVRDTKNPVLAEVAHLLPEGKQLSTFRFLLGGQSLIVTGTDGSLDIYFILRRTETNTEDGMALIKGRTFPAGKSPVTLFAPGTRGKSFAVAHEDGVIRVLHGTSQKTLAKFTGGKGATYANVVLAPRNDGVMAVQDNGRVLLREFYVPHPETTFASLFQKVWYEGYQEPTFTWQSSAATDDFEPKLSLIPLIFGTIKAAVYSLLFAIPIAILAAIYTSEFVHPNIRSVVKPAMEMMASLPSVVLGFVAALVLAPIVETWIAAVLMAFIAIPIGLMLSAYVWQLLPFYLANRWRGIPKFSIMTIVMIVTLFVTYTLGPLFEFLFFNGDFKAWANGVGQATPFLFLILLPISFVMIAALVSRFGDQRISEYMLGISPFQAAIFDIVKWLVMVGSTCVVSYLLAVFFNSLGLDARGGVVGTYVQRNTLMVGFAMGFAVIPIIYTIAEDALNAVPAHLRAASLGCGATQWQTAIYVVLPTAMSGVFSAIMIGMGRAVGETMIVVMAAGNTPIMEWNVFNGLRALSATIAVELPEAVKGGSLYRILFLSGLVLFAMTFVINTIAELVRIRFRRRAAQL
jgi:phosphate transport system permease protein